MTIRELIKILDDYPDKDAAVKVEQSGDGDFSDVVGVCDYTVAGVPPKDDWIALDIGHRKHHHPADAW